MTAESRPQLSGVSTAAQDQPVVRPLVSVVIPAYNEADIFVASINALWDYLQAHLDEYRWELLIVDDGSTDMTAELADAFAELHEGVKLLRHTGNFKLGQALRTAFASCTGDYVVTMDCDLSYSPEHIGLMLGTIRETKAQVVMASPYTKGGRTLGVPRNRLWFSRLANRYLALTASGSHRTITGMVRAYEGDFLRLLSLKAMDVEINAEIIYKAQLLRAAIEEVPATLDWTAIRRHRASRLASSRLTRTAAYSLLSGFFFRPFMFFVIPGLLLALTAALALGMTGWPDALWLATVAALLGGQFLSLGIVTLQAKRYFEELFNLGTGVNRRVASDEPAGAGPEDSVS